MGLRLPRVQSYTSKHQEGLPAGGGPRAGSQDVGGEDLPGQQGLRHRQPGRRRHRGQRELRLQGEHLREPHLFLDVTGLGKIKKCREGWLDFPTSSEKLRGLLRICRGGLSLRCLGSSTEMRRAKRAKSRDVRIPSYKVSGRPVSSCRWGQIPLSSFPKKQSSKSIGGAGAWGRPSPSCPRSTGRG